jgi:hypothetical protein
MRTTHRVLTVVVVFVAAAGLASAQTGIRANEWSRGTTLAGFAGVAIDSPRAGPVFGGTVGWEVTPRLAIEGSGSWTAFGGHADAFGGSLTLRTRLAGHRTVDPFVRGGIGLYRAGFGAQHRDVPAFYGRRMGMHDPGTGLGRTFTDPTVVLGGGASIFMTRQVAIRPDVEAAVVMRGGHRHVVTRVTLHAVYHFEDRPVTPQRGR